ncbi:hypothetical protein FRX54_06210 [Streptococcus sp. sy004]|nr:hypothetical protein FRX54_06210 [Streptococcus sp. sy004]
MFNKMFNKIFNKNKNNAERSKRKMTDYELAHLIDKIRHNLDIIKNSNDVKSMRYYFDEISGWLDEIKNDDFKGWY